MAILAAFDDVTEDGNRGVAIAKCGNFASTRFELFVASTRTGNGAGSARDIVQPIGRLPVAVYGLKKATGL